MQVTYMAADEVETYLAQHSPSALLLEPRSMFRPSLIGIAVLDGQTVAAYDVGLIIQCLMIPGMDISDAREWFDYNIDRACFGPGAPVLVYGEE